MENSTSKARQHYNFQDLLNKAGKVTENGCIEWQMTKNSDGYGLVWVQGKFKGVHRYTLILTTGQEPDGMNALHSCDNPPCFNPDHLRWGTQLENVADRDKRNRTARLYGEDSPASTLKPKDVYLIRKMWVEGATVEATALAIGCSRGAVSHVRAGRTWSHLK